MKEKEKKKTNTKKYFLITYTDLDEVAKIILIF